MIELTNKQQEVIDMLESHDLERVADRAKYVWERGKTFHPDTKIMAEFLLYGLGINILEAIKEANIPENIIFSVEEAKKDNPHTSKYRKRK